MGLAAAGVGLVEARAGALGPGLPFGLSLLEKLALGSDAVGHFVSSRVFGGFDQAFVSGPRM